MNTYKYLFEDYNKDIIYTKEFKAWFGDWENDPANSSKIVDKDGKPKVVYHCTNKKFDTFNLSSFGKSAGNGRLGAGFYFTDNEGEAKSYGSTIMDCYLNCRNVLDFYNKIPESEIYQIYVNGDNNWFFNSYLPKVVNTDNNNTIRLIKDGILNKGDFKVYTDEEIKSFTKEDLCKYKANKDKNQPLGHILEWACNAYTSKELLVETEFKVLNADCISEKFSRTSYQYCVFFPNQIKSIENNGNFSLNSNNIYEGLYK